MEQDAEHEPLASIAIQLRTVLAEAEANALRLHNELDAARLHARMVRDQSIQADAEVKRLRRGLDAIENQHRPIGRPRGSADSNGTRERIKTLLPTRPEWTSAELRDALVAEGHEVTVNAVTAALASLKTSGDAYRSGKGRWTNLSIDTTPIDCDAVRTYLSQQGWTMQREDEAKQVWCSSRSDRSVVLPKQQLADYADLMNTMLETVARAEQRSTEDLTIDLSQIASRQGS